jgi:hypothetical protein
MDKSALDAVKSINKVDDSVLEESNRGVFEDWVLALENTILPLLPIDSPSQWYGVVRQTVKQNSTLLLNALQSAQYQDSTFKTFIDGL